MERQILKIRLIDKVVGWLAQWFEYLVAEPEFWNLIPHYASETLGKLYGAKVPPPPKNGMLDNFCVSST